MLPKDKSHWVLRNKESGHCVGFVGDGLNDCVALVSSSVGVVLQEMGSHATIDAADAVLQGSISAIPSVILFCQRVQWLVTANIALAITINIVILVAAIFFHLPLWLSVAADGGSLLLILANSLWPLCW